NKPGRAHQSALDRPVSFPTGSDFGLPERELSNLRSSICGFDGEDVDSWIPATSAGMTLNLSFNRPSQTTGHPGPCARDPECHKLWRRIRCEMCTYILAGSELVVPREALAAVDAQSCSPPPVRMRRAGSRRQAPG